MAFLLTFPQMIKWAPREMLHLDLRAFVVWLLQVLLLPCHQQRLLLHLLDLLLASRCLGSFFNAGLKFMGVVLALPDRLGQ